MLTVPWNNLIWFSNHIARVSYIVWMAIYGRLNTMERLVLFGIKDNAHCVLCNGHTEDHNHLFFECPFSSRIWTAMQAKCNVNWPPLAWIPLLEWLAAHIKGNYLAANVKKPVFTYYLLYLD